MGFLFFASVSVAAEIDIGLKIREEGVDKRVAVDDNAAVSPLKINKNGRPYAVLLVSPSDPARLKTKIKTAGPIKHLKEFGGVDKCAGVTCPSICVGNNAQPQVCDPSSTTTPPACINSGNSTTCANGCSNGSCCDTPVISLSASCGGLCGGQTCGATNKCQTTSYSPASCPTQTQCVVDAACVVTPPACADYSGTGCDACPFGFIGQGTCELDPNCATPNLIQYYCLPNPQWGNDWDFQTSIAGGPVITRASVSNAHPGPYCKSRLNEDYQWRMSYTGTGSSRCDNPSHCSVVRGNISIPGTYVPPNGKLTFGRGVWSQYLGMTYFINDATGAWVSSGDLGAVAFVGDVSISNTTMTRAAQPIAGACVCSLAAGGINCAASTSLPGGDNVLGVSSISSGSIGYIYNSGVLNFNNARMTNTPTEMFQSACYGGPPITRIEGKDNKLTFWTKPISGSTCGAGPCPAEIEVAVVNFTPTSPNYCDDGNQISGDGCSANCLKENMSAQCTEPDIQVGNQYWQACNVGARTHSEIGTYLTANEYKTACPSGYHPPSWQEWFDALAVTCAPNRVDTSYHPYCNGNTLSLSSVLKLPPTGYKINGRLYNEEYPETALAGGAYIINDVTFVQDGDGYSKCFESGSDQNAINTGDELGGNMYLANYSPNLAYPMRCVKDPPPACTNTTSYSGTGCASCPFGTLCSTSGAFPVTDCSSTQRLEFCKPNPAWDNSWNFLSTGGGLTQRFTQYPTPGAYCYGNGTNHQWNMYPTDLAGFRCFSGSCPAVNNDSQGTGQDYTATTLNGNQVVSALDVQTCIRNLNPAGGVGECLMIRLSQYCSGKGFRGLYAYEAPSNLLPFETSPRSLQQWSCSCDGMHICSGPLPANASSCPVNAPLNTSQMYPTTLASSCDGSTICQATCASGYTWNGSTCDTSLPTACSTQLDGSVLCSGSGCSACPFGTSSFRGATICNLTDSSGHTWQGRYAGLYGWTPWYTITQSVICRATGGWDNSWQMKP